MLAHGCVVLNIQPRAADIQQDFLMDWSMLKTRAKYFLLRDEVLYTNHIPVRSLFLLPWPLLT